MQTSGYMDKIDLSNTTLDLQNMTLDALLPNAFRSGNSWEQKSKQMKELEKNVNISVNRMKQQVKQMSRTQMKRQLDIETKLRVPKSAIESIGNQIRALQNNLSNASESSIQMGNELKSLQDEKLELQQRLDMIMFIRDYNNPHVVQNHGKGAKGKLFAMVQADDQYKESTKILQQAILILSQLNRKDYVFARQAMEKRAQQIEQTLAIDLKRELSNTVPNKQKLQSIVKSMQQCKGHTYTVLQVATNLYENSSLRWDKKQRVHYPSCLNRFERLAEAATNVCKKGYVFTTEYLFDEKMTVPVHEILVANCISVITLALQHIILKNQDLADDRAKFLDVYCQTFAFVTNFLNDTSEMVHAVNHTSFAKVGFTSYDSRDQDTDGQEHHASWDFAVGQQLDSIFGSTYDQFLKIQMDFVIAECEKFVAESELPECVLQLSASNEFLDASLRLLSMRKLKFKGFQKAEASSIKEVDYENVAQSLEGFSARSVRREKILLEHTTDALKRITSVFCKKECGIKTISNVYTVVATTLISNFWKDVASYALQLVKSAKRNKHAGIWYLRVLKFINSGVEQCVVQFDDIIAPSIKVFPTYYTIGVERVAKALEGLENAISNGLIEIIDQLDAIVADILRTEQKTQDYNPVDGYVAEVATTACDSTAELLGDAIAHVKLSLMDDNFIAFGELAAQKFFDTFIGHIKTLRISADGSFLLARDISIYRSLFSVFNSKLVMSLFDQLQSICSIFIVAIKNVDELLQNDCFVDLKPSLLDELLKSRTDYKMYILDS